MKTVLYVVADTNDADYITGEFPAVAEYDIQLIEKVSSVLKKGGHNWVTSEYARVGESPEEMYADVLTPEEIDQFEDFVPYGEYGIHTIVTLELRKIEILKKFI